MILTWFLLLTYTEQSLYPCGGLAHFLKVPNSVRQNLKPSIKILEQKSNYEFKQQYQLKKECDSHF